MSKPFDSSGKPPHRVACGTSIRPVWVRRRAVRDYRDDVIEELADDCAALREQNRDLIDLVADVAFENAQLRRVCLTQIVEGIYATATIARLQRQLHQQRTV